MATRPRVPAREGGGHPREPGPSSLPGGSGEISAALGLELGVVPALMAWQDAVARSARYGRARPA